MIREATHLETVGNLLHVLYKVDTDLGEPRTCGSRAIQSVLGASVLFSFVVPFRYVLLALGVNSKGHNWNHNEKRKESTKECVIEEED